MAFDPGVATIATLDADLPTEAPAAVPSGDDGAAPASASDGTARAGSPVVAVGPTTGRAVDRGAAAGGRTSVAPDSDRRHATPVEGGSRRGNAVAEPQVAAMFDEIAPVYDRMNTLMTLGADRRWRAAAVVASGVGEGGSAIDVACGTGKLSAALAERVGPFGRVLGVDFAPAMIERASAANRDLVQLEFRVGNALALPAGDAEFDAATIAFGLRNLADYEAGFRELRRVVRPGGTVVCLELSLPRPRVWARVYHGLFRRAAPLIGALFRHREAYRYLPDSLDGFPDPRELAATMRRAGLMDITWRRRALGTVAIHRGRVPPG